MAYRFKLDESLDEGFLRIALEQFERAERELQSSLDNPAGVHETRKAIKRLRALLRLVRPSLSAETFVGENVKLRDIAHMLSGARDTHVLIQTITKLASGAGKREQNALQTLKAKVSESANGHVQSLQSNTVGDALAALGKSRERIAQLNLEPKTIEGIAAGLDRAYRSARRKFRAALAEKTDEAFHEWRKGVQHHWRHMALLSRGWPGVLLARAAEARSLSQVLGDDHDLAILAIKLKTGEDAALTGLTKSQIARIGELSASRQKDLRALAETTGARLFSDKASDLSRRVATYWTAAEKIARAEGERGQAPQDKTSTKPLRGNRAPSA